MSKRESGLIRLVNYDSEKMRQEVEAIMADVRGARLVAECLAGDVDPAVGHLGSAQKCQLDRADARLGWLLDAVLDGQVGAVVDRDAEESAR